MTDNIYLNTAFAVMACDGDISPDEIKLIKNLGERIGEVSDADIDEKIAQLTAELNHKGKNFMSAFLAYIRSAAPDHDAAMHILGIAVDMIHADEEVEYPEVKFFRALRACMTSVTDDEILGNFPLVEDFWLESDAIGGHDGLEKDYLEAIEMPQFDLSAISALLGGGSDSEKSK